MTATTFLYLFLIFYIVEYVLNYWLDVMNIKNIESNPNLPGFFKDAISTAAYQKSRSYSLVKLRFNKWHMFITSGLTLLVLFSGILPNFYTIVSGWAFGPIWEGVSFMFILYAFLAILKYPLGLYETFKIEAAFGFNKTTMKLYIIDSIKTMFLSLAIGVPILAGFLWFMFATGDWWWVWAWLFIALVQILLMVIYPVFLAPLFNKFQTLPEGELKESLLALTKTLRFPVSGIFVMDGSRRSAHSNAYFTGFGKFRRIVVYDTLIEQMSIPEMETILTHEIGHYKKGHIFRMLAFNLIFLFAGLYMLSLLIDWPPLYQAFGFEGEPESLKCVGLFLFSITFSTFTFILGPFINVLSRKHEYEADAFSVENSPSPIAMENALIKLAEKNASNLTPHPWYSAFHYSHPSIHERLLAIRRTIQSVS